MCDRVKETVTDFMRAKNLTLVFDGKCAIERFSTYESDDEVLVSCSRGWSKYRCSMCVHVKTNVYVFYITTVLIYSVYFWCVDTIFCNLICGVCW